MMEIALRVILSDLVKVVHVQLSHKRGVVAVFEVLGQNLFAEVVLVDYDEADTVCGPFDNMRVLLILNERGFTLSN